MIRTSIFTKVTDSEASPFIEQKDVILCRSGIQLYTAKELASLSKIIKEKRVKALFVEPYYKGSAANILERETGVSVYVLNPVTSGEKTLTAYEDIMRENIKTVLKAVEA